MRREVKFNWDSITYSKISLEFDDILSYRFTGKEAYISPSPES